MQALHLARKLGPLEARTIGRDALLRWMIALPLVIALAIRLVLPIVLAQLESLLKLELTIQLATIGSFALLLIIPCLFGLVLGFLLLDQRDDHTLIALQVTPLTLQSYVLYRLSVPMVLSVVLTPAALMLSGREGLTLAAWVGALAAAPLAPLIALALAAFAGNKVQGFALAKAASALMIIPLLAALFVPMPWQLVAGLLPTYWPMHTYGLFVTGDRSAWLFLGVGAVYHSLLLILLLRRFERVLHQ